MSRLRIAPDTARLTVKIKQKKCAICGTLFDKRSMTHVACSIPCSLAVAQIKRDKADAKQALADRKETKSKIQALKGLSYWEGRAQHAVNKFIRVRDAGQPCISCGITYSTVWQAGHFIAVGANSTLRYVEDNIHLQCVQCNLNKSGNATPYRIRLIAKIGIARVEALEAWHSPVKSTVEMCQAIEAEFNKRFKEFKAAQ